MKTLSVIFFFFFSSFPNLYSASVSYLLQITLTSLKLLLMELKTFWHSGNWNHFWHSDFCVAFWHCFTHCWHCWECWHCKPQDGACLLNLIVFSHFSLLCGGDKSTFPYFNFVHWVETGEGITVTFLPGGAPLNTYLRFVSAGHTAPAAFEDDDFV